MSTQGDPAATDQAIIDAQNTLSRTIDRAKIGDDRQLASVVRERGEQCARLFAAMFRMTRMHDTKNAAFNQPIDDLTAHMDALRDLLGSVHLLVVEDQIYVNDIRVRFDMQNETPRHLNAVWRKWGVGGFSFHGPVTPSQFRELIAYVALQEPTTATPRTELQTWLEALGLSSLELHPVFRFRLKNEEAVKRGPRDVQKIYGQSAAVVGQVWGSLTSGRSPNVLPVRRMVTEMVEMDAKEQAREVLTIARDRRVPPYSRHALQVASLSLMIGRELGLPEAILSDLGVAACFHDVGYTVDEDGYAPPFERHGAAGVRRLLSQRGFHEARIRRMLACLQHHHPYNAERTPTLFARIIHIADDFDTLTRLRAGGPMMAPPDAVAAMCSVSGTEYDPDLLQLFVNRVGRYPPGSIVELEDGRWLVAVSGVRAPELFDKPLCLMVKAAGGKPAPKGTYVDLSEDGRVARVIRG